MPHDQYIVQIGDLYFRTERYDTAVVSDSICRAYIFKTFEWADRIAAIHGGKVIKAPIWLHKR